MVQYTDQYQSPLGPITLASDGTSLTGLWFDGQKYFAATLGENRQDGHLPVFRQTKKWLDRYFAGEQPDFMPALSPAGSPFRQAVWDMLRQIPYGTVMSYGAIAKKMADQLGKPGLFAQAVGGAVSHNPISILIPCHRVVGQNGSLTGYAGGLDRKIQLLTLEKTPMDKLFRPKKGTAL